MSVKTARRGAAWLVASALLSFPLAADDEPWSELAQVKAQILRCDDASLHPPEDGETCDRALDRLWELMRQSTVGFLNAHPQASVREVQADLATRVEQDDLPPSAVRLSGDAIVVSIAWGFYGDAFIVSRAPEHAFAVTWDLRALAEKGPPDGELAAWSYADPGIHSGPLGGRALALPPTRAGRPRFLIDAFQHSEMGTEVPGQVSVWEWSGREATPELIKTYVTTGGSRARLRGDRVLIFTKEMLQTLYTCGSCDDPQGTWTLRITPDGVTDLGHALDQPLLKFVDDLLARVVRRQDTSAVASPRARAKLEEVIAGLREEDAELETGEQLEASGEEELRLGMMMNWKVSRHGKQRRIDLETDRIHVILTLAQRAGKPYVVAVRDLYEEVP
jgi:hypothetical protein